MSDKDKVTMLAHCLRIRVRMGPNSRFLDAVVHLDATGTNYRLRGGYQMTTEEKLKVLCHCMGLRCVDTIAPPLFDRRTITLVSHKPLMGLMDRSNNPRLVSTYFYDYDSTEDALNALLAWTPNNQPK